MYLVETIEKDRVVGLWQCYMLHGRVLTFSARVLASRASCSQTRARSRAPSLSTFIACIFFLMASMVAGFVFYCYKLERNCNTNWNWKSRVKNCFNVTVRNQSINSILNNAIIITIFESETSHTSLAFRLMHKIFIIL